MKTMRIAIFVIFAMIGVVAYSQIKGDELYQKGKECYDNKDYKTAAEWFRKSAEQGDKNGQTGLGW